MKLKITLCAALASVGLAAGGADADPLAMPAMSATLSANPKPTTFDAGPLGKIYVTGAVTGLLNGQNHSAPGDEKWDADISNGQVFVQKTDGLFQFFVQAGAYSLPDLAVPYGHLTDSRTVENATFGFVPQAFVKFAPTAEFNIIAGKLPTLIGGEYTFSFENMNVNRGIVWNQENAVNRGVQANYSKGPLTVSVSWNDGFYSDRFNWVSGLISYAVTPKDTLAFVGMGNLGKTSKSTFATPIAQNNSDMFNILWTHTESKWMINPYVQYTHVAAKPEYGWTHSSDTWGVALLSKYAITPEWSVAFRPEYIKQTGHKGDLLAPTLLYGPGSSSWAVTVTPTFQKGIFFIRADGAYVHTSVPAFGSTFGEKNQFRFTGEAGVLF